MLKAIIGTIAGLLIGSIGALAYSHYLGDGSLLTGLQAQLDATNAKLAKSESDRKFLAEQNNSTSDQVNALVASNEELKKQVADPGPTSDAEPTPSAPQSIFDPNLIRGIMGAMRGGFAGGFRSPEQRMFLLQARLKLDPDQTKALKAAMDADNQARRQAFQQARQNGKPPDFQALAAASTLDKTIATVLSPAQQTAYQQVQSDEKAARAETAATAQVDNLMPLLQLTDDQKEKAMNALYQQQLSAPDAASLMRNPGNALGTLSSQGQSMQAAMKAVLSPDQFALYQQSDQLQAQGFGNRRGNNNGRNNNGGGNNGGAAPGTNTTAQSVATPAPTPAPAATPDTTSSTTNAASSTTPDTASSTTNAASATTNAASASAPASASAN